jgi:transposase
LYNALIALDPDTTARDEIARLTARLQQLELAHQEVIAQHQELLTRYQAGEAEREALRAKVVWLTHMLRGHVSEKQPVAQASPAAAPTPGIDPTLITLPVDAGVTAEEAEGKKASREERERQREQRKNAKDRKKGKGPDGAAKPVNGGGRRPVNPELPPREITIEVPQAERVDAKGVLLPVLDYEVTTQEFLLPAALYRLIIKRELRGYAHTREVVARGPIPPAIVPRSKYHDTMLIEATVRKFMRGMPFTRVVQDFQAMGSDITAAVLSDQARRMAEFLAPVVDAIVAQVMAEPIVHMDETTMPTQDGQRYLWAIMAAGQICFHVGGRGGNELRLFLGLPLKDPTPAEAARAAASQGRRPRWKIAHAMTDGYAVYQGVLTEAGITRYGCWAHGRRGFRPWPEDPVMTGLIAAIGGLYAVESQAQTRVERDGLEGEAATAIYTQLRAERSVRQLAVVKQALVDASTRYAHGSQQWTKIHYILDDWPAFEAYASDGRLPIDNNDLERAFRMYVVGRKSWMFIGSEDAAPHAAALFTVMESCRISRVEPRGYLTYVVERLHAKDTPAEQLTPRALAPRYPLRE